MAELLVSDTHACRRGHVPSTAQALSTVHVRGAGPAVGCSRPAAHTATARGTACHLLLFDRVYQFFEGVSHELYVLHPCQLTFFDTSVDREKTCLVQLLGLDQGVNPCLLPVFKRLYHLALVQQVLLILAEVLSADIFDFSKLFIVLFL